MAGVKFYSPSFLEPHNYSDIDECKGYHQCNTVVSRCENIYGSYVCICNDGYMKTANHTNCSEPGESLSLVSENMAANDAEFCKSSL